MIGVPGRPRSPEKTIVVSRSGRRRRAAGLDPEPDDRRAEDVAGVEVGRVDAGRDLALLVVADRVEVLDRRLGVVGVVERLVEVDLDLRRLAPQVRLEVVERGRGGAARAAPAGLPRGLAARSSRPRHLLGDAGRRDRGGLRRGRRRSSGGGASSTCSWAGGAAIRPAARSTAAWYRSCSLRSSSATRSGCFFSQRASRFANSCWSLPESRRTSSASSHVPAVAMIRPR